MNTHIKLMFRSFIIWLILFNPNSKADAQIDSIVLSAIKNCDAKALALRLKSNININALDKNGANALMYAAYYCNLPMVKYLVHQGAIAPDSGVIYDKEVSFGSLQNIAAKGKLNLLEYLSDSLHLS